MATFEDICAWMRHGLRCPSCGAEQIQCLDYRINPTRWRCRMCKHKWEVANGE